jgi:hypothetical protein
MATGVPRDQGREVAEFAAARYRGAFSQGASRPGGSMPRYLSLHTLACLTRQGAGQLTERIFSSRRVKARRVQVNMMEGKMLLECEAPDREALEAWLKGEGFHYEWLMRIEFESESGPLAPVS